MDGDYTSNGVPVSAMGIDDTWKSVNYDREQEEKHFSRIVRAFRNYRQCHLRRLNEKQKHVNSLPEHHKKMLQRFAVHLSHVRDCIERNAEFIDEMVDGAEKMFLNEDGYRFDDEEPIKPLDMDKVDSTMVQFVRDWSEEGFLERAASYEPILTALREEFAKVPESERHEIRVLVPGAGLGRLAYEIFCSGFSSQGNEVSMFMLIASNYILNRFPGEPKSRFIYPWAPRFCNNVLADNQIRAVAIPDTITTSGANSQAEFSMIAGEFVDIYKNQGPEKWDCVATCFFLDTANNVLEYVETIYDILKPGGVWINLGPMLYHYADAKAELSVEPPYDLLKECIINIGFEFEVSKIDAQLAPFATHCW